MEIVDIKAGLGCMLKGMKNAGFVPVLAVEQSPTSTACIKNNLQIEVVKELPSHNKIPRHEAICGSFRSGMRTEDINSLVSMASACRPRCIFLELGHRFDVSLLTKQLSNYKLWSIVLNSNGWSHISRFSTFVVAFRSDIKVCFEEFPFPEEVMFGERPSLIVDARGDCGLVLGQESAKDFIGISDFNVGDISQRRIFAEPNVDLIKSIGVEIKSWIQ